MLGKLHLIDQAEHQALTAADNGRRNFVFFCGSQDEDHIRRWFFNGLEQSVEGFFGQHVALVDDI